MLNRRELLKLVPGGVIGGLLGTIFAQKLFSAENKVEESSKDFAFKCPVCGYNGLEEVEIGAKPGDFNKPFSAIGIYNNEKADFEDKKAYDHYQCRKCHYVLNINGEKVTDMLGVGKWMKIYGVPAKNRKEYMRLCRMVQPY